MRDSSMRITSISIRKSPNQAYSAMSAPMRGKSKMTTSPFTTQPPHLMTIPKNLPQTGSLPCSSGKQSKTLQFMG